MSNQEIRVNDIVLMKNNKPIDRKGGKLSQKRLSRYAATKISEKGVVTLKNTSGLTLNKKYNVANVKHYFQEVSNNTSSTAICSSNFSSDAPDEIVEMISIVCLAAVKTFIEKCETDNSIKSTCQKWSKIAEGKGLRFFREFILIRGNL